MSKSGSYLGGHSRAVLSHDAPEQFASVSTGNCVGLDRREFFRQLEEKQKQRKEKRRLAREKRRLAQAATPPGEEHSEP